MKKVAASPSGRRGRPTAWIRSRDAAALLPFVLWTLAPLGVPAAGLLNALEHGGLSGLYGERVFILLLKSLGMASLSALLAVCLGVGAAAWLVSGAGWARGLARVLMPLPFLIPSCVYAEAWIASFGSAGVLSGVLSGIESATGFGGAVLLLALANAPIPALLVLWTFESLPGEYLETALILDEGRLWRDVVLPLAGPPALAGFGVSFALGLVDYSVPSLMQFNVYSMEIYAEYSQSADGSRALWLALPLLAVAVLAVLAGLAGIRSAPWRQEGARGMLLTGRLQAPVLIKLWAGVAASVMAAGVILPGIALVFQVAGRPVALKEAASAGADLAASLGVALGAAALAVALGSPLAWLLARRGSLAAWVFTALPLAVPGPLYAISLSEFANLVLPRAFQDSTWILSAAHAGRFLPIAVLAMASQFGRLDGAALDAARLCPSGRAAVFFRILLPMASRGVWAGAGVAFALSLGEVASTLILVPPGTGILVLKLYNLLHYGAGGTVAALALLQAGLAVAGWVIVLSALRKQRLWK